MSANIRNFLRASVLIASVVVAASHASAANYYVDYVGGVDSNDGGSTNSAWKHCPGDPTAGGKPAATALNPGDSVFFKGGVQYILAATFKNPPYTWGIVLAWDGAANNPITYDGNSSGNWGTGRAIITDNYGTNIVNAFGASRNVNYLNFRNFEIGPIGGAPSLPADPGSPLPSKPGGGICVLAAMNNVLITNCYFHDLGYWFNQKPMSASSIGGGAFECQGASNLTIVNCEFTKMMVCVELQIPNLMTNLVIANCNFHDYIVWCIDIAHTANGCVLDGVYIHDNQFHDFDKNYGSASIGGPWTGYGDPPHQDGIFTRADNLTSFSDGTNINFYNNYFYDTFNWSGGTSCIFLVGSTSANIYNNVFNATPEPNAALTINVGDPTNYVVNILNNTFCMNGSTCLYLGGSVATGTSLWPLTKNTVNLRNNIFYDLKTGVSYNYEVVFDAHNTSAVSDFSFDYNDFTSFNLNNAFGLWAAGMGYLTIPSMRAVGWEAHGMTNSPVFVDLSHITNAYLNNLHLTASSPARNAGLNLASFNLPGLNNDKDGNPRPTTGPWSIGAYQYSSGTASSPPPAPQNLRLLNSIVH